MESGLVSLKAELFKKRSEINGSAGGRSLESRVKGTNNLKIKGFEAPKLITAKPIKLKTKKSELKDEESLALEKSKSMLEKKALLYEKLKGGVDVLENEDLNQKFLINFQKKIIDEVEGKKNSCINDKSQNISSVDEAYPAKNQNEEWVEYTDEFGRSRVSLRQDLPSTVLSKDTVAAEEVKERNEAQHKKWLKVDAESERKDQIHYKDILYDEARDHGVGFMPFSRDTSERIAQQDLLREFRNETKTACVDKQTDLKRKKRALAERLLKVRQRKRLKAGLPMQETEEDKLKTPPPSDEEEEPVMSPPVEVTVQISDEKPLPKVREWDLGKPGTSHPLSQEQWVENRRKIRENDFAPPSIYINQSNNNQRTKYPNFIAAKDKISDISTSSVDFNASENSTNFTNIQTTPENPKNNDFAPPSTYEYYGPSGKSYRNRVKNDSMEQAIAKGLSKLRQNNS